MIKNILESAKNLKSTKVLCTCAIFVALYIILSLLQIPITPQSRLTLTFLTTVLAGYLFGVVPAMIVGALGDIVGFILHPTGAYFPGFTITAMLSGLIYGICLYKRNHKTIIWWIILSKSLVTVFLNILLNTYWISILYQKAFYVFMISRIVKNLILLPIEVVIMFIVITLIDRHKIHNNV